MKVFFFPFALLLFCTAASAQIDIDFPEREFSEDALSGVYPAEISMQITEYSKEINQNPNLAGPYIKRGHAKSLLGDYRGAVADFNRAVELKPDDAVRYAERGKARIRLGDYKNAVADYTVAIERDSLLKGAFMQRAYAKKQLGDHRGAAADFAKERAMRPADEGAYLSGLERYFSGDYLAAISEFDKAVELNPGHAQFFYHRGKAKARLDDHAGAAEDFGAAVRLNPKDVSAIVQRGLSEIEIGNTDAGCLHLSRAGELGYERAYVLIRERCAD